MPWAGSAVRLCKSTWATARPGVFRLSGGAYEDAAARAILAGLALVEAAGALRSSIRVFPQLRVGIATWDGGGGRVDRRWRSAGTGGRVGETLNLAARLQALAACPISIVITPEATWILAGGAFNYEDLGPQTLKGIFDSGSYLGGRRREQRRWPFRGPDEDGRDAPDRAPG